MKQLKQLKAHLTQYFPAKLPITEEGLDRLTDQILTLGGLPDDADSRTTVASAIMHLGPTTDAKPVRYFVKSIRKALVNKIAFEKMRSIQEKLRKDSEDAKPTGLQEAEGLLVQEA